MVYKCARGYKAVCLPATGRPPAWLRDGQGYGGRWPPVLRLVQTVHKRSLAAPIAEGQ